jgi:hypothetical protein
MTLSHVAIRSNPEVRTTSTLTLPHHRATVRAMTHRPSRASRGGSRFRTRHMRLLASAFLAALASCGVAAPTAIDQPPQPAAVRDGQIDDADRQEVRSSFFANWDPFRDPEGAAVIYEWSVGSRPGEADIVPWTPVGGALRAAATGLELPAGALVFASVRATDTLGNRSVPASSDGIRIGTGSGSDDPRPVATPPATTPTTTTAAPENVAPPRVPPLPLAPPPTPTPTTAPAAPPRLTVSMLPSEPNVLGAVDRAGITWTFGRITTTGRFANGDWWVIGPVDIVAIQPPSVADGARVRHGAMIDPDPKRTTQGYDSAMFGDGAAARFDPTANAALGVSRERPLRLEPGQTLVSTVSQPAAGALPQLETCALLTCLSEAPTADAFRPPYAGTDKTCRWRASDLDLSRLLELEAVPGAPSLPMLTERFERTWLDHVPGWTGRHLHPRANMPDYGRELADLVGQAALALQLAAPAADKQALAIQLVQLGIDIHGIVRAGGRFVADGGSGSGRKFPLLLAATLLQDASLLATLREHPNAFAEDVQTFFVAETAPGIWNHGHGGYTADDAGMPEWGNRHGDDPQFDNKAWMGDHYRRCCTANAWSGFVLATRMMGLKATWGHDALFDYVDRYMQVEGKEQWTRAWSPFTERMWDRYRPRF